MHRIGPRAELPEFYVEAGYLQTLALLWSIARDNDIELQAHYGAIDLSFLGQWYRHREALTHYVNMAGFNPRNISRDVKPCLEFVDALVKDWVLQVSGGKPERPLSSTRLEELREHQRRLEAIPGDRWEIKY